MNRTPPPRRRVRRALAAAAVALIALTASASDARTFTRVTVPSVDLDERGVPVMLDGFMLLPDGPVPPGGFPAIVALHGCSGAYSTTKGREAELAERLMARADLLLGDGYAVLFPDSFGARGRHEVCTVKRGEKSINATRRKLDALGALAWLAQRRDVAPDRIALVGWSHGGSAVLATINARDRDVIAFRERAGAPPFFRAAVAFYPGCRTALAEGERWQASVPVRILIGALDDWTPAAPCVALGTAATARGEPLKVVVFPDAHHGFDAPGSTIVHRTDVPNGVAPGQGVHVGPNPAMRDRANAKLRAFLDQSLRGAPAD